MKNRNITLQIIEMQVVFEDMVEDLSVQVQVEWTHIHVLVLIAGSDACAPNCFWHK